MLPTVQRTPSCHRCLWSPPPSGFFPSSSYQCGSFADQRGKKQKTHMYMRRITQIFLLQQQTSHLNCLLFFFFILKKYLKSLFFFFRFTSTKFNTCTNKKRRTLLLQLHTDILCQPVHECTLPKQNLSWNRDQQSSKPPLILMGQYKICTHFLGWPLLPTDRFSSQLCFTIVSGGGGKGPN